MVVASEALAAGRIIVQLKSELIKTF